jgi:hypothetical protein
MRYTQGGLIEKRFFSNYESPRGRVNQGTSGEESSP